MVVLSLALYLGGLMYKPGLAYVAQLPFLVAIIMNAIAYSKANGGYVTFGNVFGSGFKLSMVVAIIMTAWSVICIYAFPEMKVQAMEMTKVKMAENPQVTDEQIETFMNMWNKGYNYIMVATAIFGTLIMGAIFALIGAAVAEKKGERPITSEF